MTSLFKWDKLLFAFFVFFVFRLLVLAFSIGIEQINRTQTRIGFSANQLLFLVAKSFLGNRLSISAFRQTNGFHITLLSWGSLYSFSSSSSLFGFEIGWSWRIQSPDMNDELTNLIWVWRQTRFDRRCGRTCLDGREWRGLDMDGWKGGRSGMEFGCQSGPRVLRDCSIMNPPVEISDINTNSFGMSNESWKQLTYIISNNYPLGSLV